MASRFTALPLSSGESFLLETDHEGRRWVVLVDGGQSKSEGPKKNPLYKALRKYCPEVTRKIDIAICTHRDHDHAGGYPAFIKTWLGEGNEIGEFWLPGAWAGAVEFALTNPDSLVALLQQGARRAASEIGHSPVSYSILRSDRKSTSRADDQSFASIDAQLGALTGRHKLSLKFGEPIEPTRIATTVAVDDPLDRVGFAAESWGFSKADWVAIRQSLEESEIFDEALDARLARHREWQEFAIVPSMVPEGRQYHVRLSPDEFSEQSMLAATLAKRVIDTAEAIRAISTAAAMFDIPVRWFDFAAFESGANPSGGRQGLLVPLNSVEVRGFFRESDPYALFLKLTLTEQNVASLVFQRVESDSEPGAIFLGDSRLAFGIDAPERDFARHLVSPSRPIVLTAAHHGSRNNDHAYRVLRSWIGVLFEDSITVRNGGVWNQKLDGYLRIRHRRCAQCYQCRGGDWAQLVQVKTAGSTWTLPVAAGQECATPRRP